MGARCQNLDPAQLETLQRVHGLTLLDAINLDKKAAGGLVQITFFGHSVHVHIKLSWPQAA